VRTDEAPIIGREAAIDPSAGATQFQSTQQRSSAYFEPRWTASSEPWATLHDGPADTCARR
jgi:hypothetical protein